MCETEGVEFEQVPMAVSIGGCRGTPVRPEMNQTVAETVLRGGPILTLDPRRPVVDALAIRAGRITHSGTSAEIAPLIGRSTEVIELHGNAVVPRFIDCHTHMGLGSFPAHRITEVGLSKDALSANLGMRG